MKDTILLTGITGFVGSHLAEYLSQQQYKIIGITRPGSDLSRYNEIKNDNILLVNLEDEGAIKKIEALKPKFFIHSAWSGVVAGGRDDWQSQSTNIPYTTRLLQLAKEIGIQHFITFGSQAEYGAFEGRVDENYPARPVSAYGASKLAMLQIQRSFCEQNNMHWNWFRLFSVYGTREGGTWLIPSVIKNAMHATDMELTPCEQRYDYIYAKDLGIAIQKVLEHEPVSGVFNLSSNNSVPLKKIVEAIRDKTATKANFKIGALPYRPNQVMQMEGNSDKFFNTFNFKPASDFNSNIEEVIKYYQSKF